MSGDIAIIDACERCRAPILGAAKWKRGTPTPEVPISHVTPDGQLDRVEWVCRACAGAEP